MDNGRTPHHEAHAKALLLDVDDVGRNALQRHLQSTGFIVTPVDEPLTVPRLLATGDFDLLVMDIELDSVDPFRLCEVIRSVSPIPIVIATDQVDPGLVVRALDGGADKYLSKRIGAEELGARLRSLLRRTARSGNGSQDRLHVGCLCIDVRGMTVHKHGIEIALTATEFHLLSHLARHPGVVMAKEALLEEVWGGPFNEPSVVAVTIGRLRRKIEDDPTHPLIVTTVRGLGYRFDGNNGSSRA